VEEPIVSIEEGTLFGVPEYAPGTVSLPGELAAARPRPTPMLDRPGTRDLPGVPAFPGAQRVANRTVFDGFVDQADYQTLEPPSAVVMFYFDQLTQAGWQATHFKRLDPGGHGWWALFRSEDDLEVINVFASVEWLDLPPGGERNITHVTVSRTNLPTEAIRQARRERDAQTSGTPAP
jgi:hypothetical protein